jgi:DUF4097 and DUF4098 domain-containing protein YvlB
VSGFAHVFFKYGQADLSGLTNTVRITKFTVWHTDWIMLGYADLPTCEYVFLSVTSTTTMKKIINLTLALLVSIAVQAQNDNDRQPYLTKSLSAESIRDVYARTSGGGITVSGVPAGETRIEVYVQPNNNRNDLSKEEIKERLKEDYELDVSVAGNTLTAIAKPKHTNMSWKRNLSISFKIYVPKNVSTDLNTSGGGISLTNLSGTHNFSTSGGGLHLDKLSGKIRGRTSGGGITVSDTHDDINLSTSGGGIDADNCSGNLVLATSGGSINLDGLQGTIQARTSGGTVRGSAIKGELETHTSGGSVSLRDLSGSVDASTSGGNMDIEIEELGKYVTVSNSGGNIQLKMPGDKGVNLKLRGERIKIEDLNNFSGEQDEHKVTGKINGGGIPVDIQTSGNITLALR